MTDNRVSTHATCFVAEADNTAGDLHCSLTVQLLCETLGVCEIKWESPRITNVGFSVNISLYIWMAKTLQWPILVINARQTVTLLSVWVHLESKMKAGLTFVWHMFVSVNYHHARLFGLCNTNTLVTLFLSHGRCYNELINPWTF